MHPGTDKTASIGEDLHAAQLQGVLVREAQSADRRLAVADRRVRGDAVEPRYGIRGYRGQEPLHGAGDRVSLVGGGDPAR